MHVVHKYLNNQTQRSSYIYITTKLKRKQISIKTCTKDHESNWKGVNNPSQGGRFQPSSQWGSGYTGHLGEKRGLDSSKVLLQCCFFLRSKINVCLLCVGRSVFPEDNHLTGLGKDEPVF